MKYFSCQKSWPNVFIFWIIKHAIYTNSPNHDNAKFFRILHSARLWLFLLANQAFSYSVVFSEPTMKTEFKLHHLHFEIVSMKIKQ